MKKIYKSIINQSGISKVLGKTMLSAMLLLSINQYSHAQTIKGLSNGNLISFEASSPSTITSNFAITGVLAGQKIVGMDYRPNTGELYALGYDETDGSARLYVINETNGMATAIGAANVILTLGNGAIGFDFNPTVDRIRVEAANNKNYRLHPVTGAIAATDGDLKYNVGDVNFGIKANIGSVAYTNSYIGTSTTSLYVFDDSLGVIALQNPPNDGTLNTICNPGISVPMNDRTTDIDIFYDKNLNTNTAYFVYNNGASVNDSFAVLSLTNCGLTSKAALGMPVEDIAVKIDRTVPALTGQIVYAITNNNQLISFDSKNPGFIRSFASITGLTAPQVLVGIDCRPATKGLYGLGYNAADGSAQVYRIDSITGIATAVNANPINLALGNGPIGFDFNPTVDRIRVTSANNANYRLNPNDGALAATDGILAFATTDANNGKEPNVGSSAYTNSVNGTTTTTLYNIDDSLNILVSQVPPNDGILNTIGSLGIIINTNDRSTDLDIYYDDSDKSNKAFMVANTDMSLLDNFYSVNLTSGSATLIGKVGFGIPVKFMSVQVDAAKLISSVNKYSTLKNYNMYPNPASSIVNIEYTATSVSNFEIKLVDYLGRDIYSTKMNTTNIGKNAFEINTNELNSGLYFVQIWNNNSLESNEKLIIR